MQLLFKSTRILVLKTSIMDKQPTISTFNSKLIALWAMSESGLGGFMHAAKIPFTGFFLGGFSVVIVTLLATQSVKPFKTILQATLLVVLVKATVSPHAPPMAYVAVAFQGIIGALCYRIIPHVKTAAIIFGLIALLESAVQKFLILTLYFGESLWKAIDLFTNSILKDLSYDGEFSMSFWIIATYTGVYTVWGGLVGWWSAGLQEVLVNHKEAVITRYKHLNHTERVSLNNPQAKRNFKLIGLAAILLFILSVFVFNGIGGKAVYALLRTLAVVLFFMYLINPLFKWFIKRFVKHNTTDNVSLTEVLQLLPVFKSFVQPAFEMANTEKGIRKYKLMVVYLLTLVLYYTPENE